ncbi:ribonuclease [Fervidobacterium thailandense]|uniref:ribonuclease n=1 Tax=Fervidobacterium thailandense TaxID=1008305 RepID=UPI000B2D57E8|nr:ribonuclease [Fervidobacterium thailandense]
MKSDIYSQQFLERLKSLETKRKVIVSVLSNYRNLSKGGVEVLVKNLELSDGKSLGKVNPLILSFLIDNLINSQDHLEAKVLEFERYGIPKAVVYELIFWMQPSKFPFPNGKIENYRDFLKSKREELRRLGLDSFLELYAYESAERENFITEIKSKILLIKPENIEDNLWLTDFLKYLSPVERSELRSKVHPYVWKVLSNPQPSVPVVIDGSNVLMQKELRGPEKIDDLLSKIATLKETYFPFFIVFDANAKYKFNTRYFNYKRTYLHSPADELILSLCKQYNAVVCSKDRFREYEVAVENIWYKLIKS